MLYQEKLQAEENPNEQGFSCFVYKGTRARFHNHCHTHIEIIYILENQLIISLDGKTRTCHKGDLIFIPMLIPHSISYANEETSSHMIFQVSPSFLEDGNSNLPRRKMVHRGKKLQKDIACSINVNGCTGQIFSEFQRICESRPEGGIFFDQEHTYNDNEISESWKLKGMVFLLFSALMEEEIIKLSIDTDAIRDILELSRIQPVLKLMVSHPEQKLSMEEASKMVCMSYYNFCRTFKQALGHSFIEYQNLLRIRQAEELLYETNMSIVEIAELLNFGSISYFNRTFKKYKGINPSDYRKRVVQKRANIKQIR